MGPGANNNNDLAAPLWQQQSLSLSSNQYAFCTMLPVMQLLAQHCLMHVPLCKNAAQSAPHSLVMQLKISSKETTLFLHPCSKGAWKGMDGVFPYSGNVK